MTEKWSLEFVDILLVENNDNDIEMARGIFKASGVPTELHVVCDGVKALEFLRCEGEFATAPVPDLILLSMNIPGTDGCEVLEEIKTDRLLKVIPVAVLSTLDGENEYSSNCPQSADLCIRKPLCEASFNSMIQMAENLYQSQFVDSQC